MRITCPPTGWTKLTSGTSPRVTVQSPEGDELYVIFATTAPDDADRRPPQAADAVVLGSGFRALRTAELFNGMAAYGRPVRDAPVEIYTSEVL